MDNKLKELAEKVKAYFNEAPAPIELAEATLKDGTKISYEGELAPGVAINVVGEEGASPAPDGEHEMEDGSLLVVAEGKLVEVKPAPEAAPAEEEMANDRLIALEEKVATLASLITTSQESHRAELAKANDQLKASQEAFKAMNDLVQALANEPAAAPTEPVQNVFKKEPRSREENLATYLKNKNN